LIINDIYADQESNKYGADKNYYTDDKNMGFLNRLFNKNKKAS
jgi:hypothetical protein